MLLIHRKFSVAAVISIALLLGPRLFAQPAMLHEEAPQSQMTAADTPPMQDAPTTQVAMRPGDEAPDFELPAAVADQLQTTGVTRLSDLRGKKNVVIAFYPRAFTGGCTTQLCGYRDDFAQFRSTETEVIAISTDSQERSDEFRIQHEMPFALVGDRSAMIVKRFGVPVKTNASGIMSAQRAVFLVDKQGIVRHVNLNYGIQKDKDALYAKMKEVSGK